MISDDKDYDSGYDYYIAKKIIEEWCKRGYEEEYLEFTDLKYLTTLPPLPSNLKKLSIESCPVRNYPQMPDGLRHFYHQYSDITRIPPLPSSVTIIGISNTKVKEINSLPPNLEHLAANNTPLNKICELPKTLKNLQLSGTNIKTLPFLPDSLIELDLDETPIKELPPLPPNLQFLSIISAFKLTSLPDIPKSLIWLHMGDTNIKELPILPLTLEDLYLNDYVGTYKYRINRFLKSEGNLTPDYIESLNKFYEEIRNTRSRERSVERLKCVKEELMAEVWKPERVIKWIEQGVDEMMMGN